MKKTVKIVKILLVAMILLLAFTVTVNAADQTRTTSGRAPGNYTGSGASVTAIENLGNQIIQIVSTIGSIASVIILVVLGIKYMMGSAEEKAEYKKTLLPYIIGAAFVFAASTIATFVFNFTSNLGG